MTSQDVSQFSSPVSKLLPFFVRSRDGWKAKHRKVKQKCKLLSNQVRSVEQSREQWRQRASNAEQRMAELEQQIEELKFGSYASSA